MVARLTCPLSCLAALVLAPTGNGQSWSPSYPPELGDAVDLAVRSGLDVWVASSDGVLRHTSDGGQHWNEVLPGAATLEAVEFETGGLGWAAGDGIWRTFDGGQSWTSTHSGSIAALDFGSTTLGIAATGGGSILTSNDGGLSWVDRGPLFGSPLLADVQALPNGDAFAAGSGGKLGFSANGSSSWFLIQSPSGMDIDAIHFLDSVEGWVVAGGDVFHTSNAGQSWTALGNPGTATLRDVHFLTSQRGWVAGESGAVFSTSDGGASWTQASGTGAADLVAVEFEDFFSGFAVGQGGVVLGSTDGGTSFSTLASGTAVPPPAVYGIDAVDPDHAWATTADDEILRTEDGGATWEGVSAGVNFQWWDVSFHDTLNGFACGDKQAFFPSVAWTSDGGRSWTSKSFGMMVDFHDIETLGPTTAIVTGSTFVWKTTDGGQTWPSVTPMPFGTYHGMDFVNPLEGWIAGSEIYRTVDGGQNFQHQFTPPVTLYDVGFTDLGIGWCVGEAGTVLKTTDHGQTWNASQIPGVSQRLRGLSVVDPRTLWVVGDDGVTATTDDGGVTWRVEYPSLPGSAQPLCAKFLDADNGWIGGWNGMGIWSRSSVSGGCPSPFTYCVAKPNSSGGLCSLSPQGPPSVGGSGFSVAFDGAIPLQPAILFYSTSGPASIPAFQGTRCVAAPLVRTKPLQADPAGSGMIPVVLDPSMVGTSRWYQVYYRDPAHPDGTGVGLSNALEVDFCD